MVTSMAICFGERRPCFKACSLLMNLTAITGVGAFIGAALRILYCMNLELVWLMDLRDVRCICAHTYRLANNPERKIARKRRDLTLIDNQFALSQYQLYARLVDRCLQKEVGPTYRWGCFVARKRARETYVTWRWSRHIVSRHKSWKNSSSMYMRYKFNSCSECDTYCASILSNCCLDTAKSSRRKIRASAILSLQRQVT